MDGALGGNVVEGQQNLGNGTQVFDPRFFIQGDRQVPPEGQGLAAQNAVYATDGAQPPAAQGAAAQPATATTAPPAQGLSADYSVLAAGERVEESVDT